MGWKQLLKTDTGWWNVTSALSPAPVSGALYARREGPRVWLDFQDLVPSAEFEGAMTLTGVLPVGARPPRNQELPLAPRIHDRATETKGAVRIMTGGSFAVYRVPAGGTVRGLVCFLTDQAMIASFPGVKA